MQRIKKKKIRGLFDLKPLYSLFQNAIDGKYSVEVKLRRNPRSNDQNGWLWGCIYPMLLDGLLNAGWEFTDVEQVHEYFKSMFAQQSVVNRHTGEIVDFPTSTARMDTVTFASYCEQLRLWGREYLGIEIPDPDPRWFRNKNKNFDYE